MSKFTFTKATKRQARARVALVGPSGSGKTYTALMLAGALCRAGGRVAVIDTERGSASKYADTFTFDVLELDSFDPRTYVQAIDAATHAGYDVLVIDSLSHAWFGKGGALELVDTAAKRSQSNNSYTAWRDVTPLHNRLVDAIVGAPMHVIATMRAKTEYILEKDRHGKLAPTKVGMAPIQRDGMEYEFDVVADMTHSLDLVVSKSRCPALTGVVINRPDEQVAEVLKAWLSDGQPETSGPAPARARVRASHAQATGPDATSRAAAAGAAITPAATGPTTGPGRSPAAATIHEAHGLSLAEAAELLNARWPGTYSPARLAGLRGHRLDACVAALGELLAGADTAAERQADTDRTAPEPPAAEPPAGTGTSTSTIAAAREAAQRELRGETL